MSFVDFWLNVKRLSSAAAVGAFASFVLQSSSCCPPWNIPMAALTQEILETGKARDPIVTIKYVVLQPSFDRMTTQLIELAAEDVTRETCGAIKVEIEIVAVDSPNFNSARFYKGDTSWIASVSEEQADEIKLGPGGRLLGATQILTNDLYSSPRWIVLVANRIKRRPFLAELVMVHEMSHALGMEHTKAPSVMMPYTPMFVFNDTMFWTDIDREEFCRVWNCNPRIFKTCSVEKSDRWPAQNAFVPDKSNR